MINFTFVHIQAEGETVGPAIELLARVLAGESAPPQAALAEVVPATVKPSRLKAAPVNGNREAAVLKALSFRPLRVTEIADAICDDKRQVAKTTTALYPLLKRLQRAGKVVKAGKEYALKGGK